ncbi:MAG: amino acid adenylation domain-containing protein [Thiohalocapsa sp.]
MINGDIGSSLLSAARRHADQPALWALGERRSYRELFEAAAGIAAGLNRIGVAPGGRVGVLSHRSTTAYTGILAALLAGCAYVPLNTRFPKERNRTIAAAAECAAIILDDACAERLDDCLGELDGELGGDLDRGLILITPESDAVRLPGRRRLARGDLGAVALEHAEVPVGDRGGAAGDDPVYILFTSGTTGAPKGVPISHANLAAYLPAIHQHVPLAVGDRVLQAADLTFDLSAHDMFLTWLNGAEPYSVPENATVLAPRLIAEHRVSACLLVPSTAARAREQGLLAAGRMPSLRHSLFAGEALPVTIAEAWQEAAPNSAVFNLYGPTEGTIHVSYFRFDRAAALPSAVVPIGRPLGRQRMALFAEGSEVADGQTGEIYLHGPQMTVGYWRAPQLDAEKFVTIDGVRWYKTGDLGRWTEAHGVLFGGRADRQVKIRGYRVELQEIEGVLRRASGREQVAVIAAPLTADGAADGCVAFVVGPPSGKGGDGDALRDACRRALPPYMVPSDIVFVTELPLNPNGKTDYKALYRHRAAAGQASV